MAANKRDQAAVESRVHLVYLSHIVMRVFMRACSTEATSSRKLDSGIESGPRDHVFVQRTRDRDRVCSTHSRAVAIR